MTTKEKISAINFGMDILEYYSDREKTFATMNSEKIKYVELLLAGKNKKLKRGDNDN